MSLTPEIINSDLVVSKQGPFQNTPLRPKDVFCTKGWIKNMTLKNEGHLGCRYIYIWMDVCMYACIFICMWYLISINYCTFILSVYIYIYIYMYHNMFGFWWNSFPRRETPICQQPWWLWWPCFTPGLFSVIFPFLGREVVKKKVVSWFLPWALQ